MFDILQFPLIAVTYLLLVRFIIPLRGGSKMVSELMPPMENHVDFNGKELVCFFNNLFFSLLININ